MGSKPLCDLITSIPRKHFESPKSFISNWVLNVLLSSFIETKSLLEKAMSSTKTRRRTIPDLMSTSLKTLNDPIDPDGTELEGGASPANMGSKKAAPTEDTSRSLVSMSGLPRQIGNT